MAGLSWWLVEFFKLPEEMTSRIITVSQPNSPNYFSKGYLKREMNEQGGVKSELAAKEIRHYNKEGVTQIIKPIMSLYNDEASPPWVIRSETGILSKNGQKLLLQGKVFIHRQKAEGIRELGIETSNLRVNLETSYAEGDDWAKLTSPPQWTEGTGIQMVFKKPITLKLLANVKSYYELN